MLLGSTLRVPRHPRDYYRTPEAFAKVGARIAVNAPYRELGRLAYALDVGAGCGVWGRALKTVSPRTAICGVDLPEVEPRQLPPCYDYWVSGDYLTLDRATLGQPDLIFGNPPFNIAEEVIRHSLALVAEGGTVLFLLRMAFLESKRRARGLFAEQPPRAVYMCDRRPKFYGNGTGVTAFAYFVWEKGWLGDPSIHWAKIGEG